MPEYGAWVWDDTYGWWWDETAPPDPSQAVYEDGWQDTGAVLEVGYLNDTGACVAYLWTLIFRCVHFTALGVVCVCVCVYLPQRHRQTLQRLQTWAARALAAGTQRQQTQMRSRQRLRNSKQLKTSGSAKCGS